MYPIEYISIWDPPGWCQCITLMRETHCSSIVQQLHDYSHNLELERAQGDEITTINFFAGTERLELVVGELGVINSPIWICLTLCHTLPLESEPGKTLHSYHLVLVMLQLSYMIKLKYPFDLSLLLWCFFLWFFSSTFSRSQKYLTYQ